MGTLLFFIGLLSPYAQNLNGRPLKIALLDTGFCPHLISPAKNIRIETVKDLTQSVRYKCAENKMNNRQFHGQWVLAELLNTKSIRPVVIYPMVIFNDKGVQHLRYWKRALEEAKSLEADIIIAAAGLPINNDQERKEASKISMPHIPLLLAAGRVSPGIKKTTLLFPHDFIQRENSVLFGSYHKALNEEGPHFKDTSLLNEDHINLYLPYSAKPRLFAELKGTSLALALGARTILKMCSQYPFNLKDCLSKLPTTQIKLKNKAFLEMVKALKFN